MHVDYVRFTDPGGRVVHVAVAAAMPVTPDLFPMYHVGMLVERHRAPESLLAKWAVSLAPIHGLG